MSKLKLREPVCVLNRVPMSPESNRAGNKVHLYLITKHIFLPTSSYYKSAYGPREKEAGHWFS